MYIIKRVSTFRARTEIGIVELAKFEMCLQIDRQLNTPQNH